MLHLGGGVALGMDVGDLLQFECAFEGQGVVVAAAEVEAVLGVGEDGREALDLLVGLQRLFQLGGYQCQFLDHLLVLVFRNRLTLLGQT